ncbi:ParB/RepB/Spo0J family partition protein [Kocuria sp. ChxB]|uniref:ParB/RepB/Spo0J family partition protein n=1 Tax=Kocuria sp. ChxB TaxID=3035474 RepID=UPI0037C11696
MDMFFLPSDPDSFSDAPSSPVGTSGVTPDGDGDTWQATRREGTSSVLETSTPAPGRESSMAHELTTSPADDQEMRGDVASEQDSSTGASDVSRETSATKGSDPMGSQSIGEDLTMNGARTRGEDTSMPAESSPETAPDSSVGVPTDGAGTTEINGDGGDLRAVPGATFAELAVTDIHPNRKQPRQVFDEDELAELAFSVKELGVLQPIVVRPSRDGGPEAYELVMGERRWRAVQAAGMSTIPAIVRETADNDLLRDALLENLHRAQLNPLEEAAAYQQLMEEFGATQEQLSERIGRSRPQISNTLRLLRLPALVQRRVAAGVLSSGHARALLALTDPAEMERLAQRIVAEGLSVRATEEAVALSDSLKRQSTRRKAPSTRHDDRLGYIADAFSDKLDTSVKIQLGARKGKMTIEFASVEDLNRIIDVLDPKLDPEN